LIFSLFENAAKNKQLFHPKIKGHISKTDKAVKTEIKFDIPIMITNRTDCSFHQLLLWTLTEA
jgi:hypothetical protein